MNNLLDLKVWKIKDDKTYIWEFGLMDDNKPKVFLVYTPLHVLIASSILCGKFNNVKIVALGNSLILKKYVEFYLEGCEAFFINRENYLFDFFSIKRVVEKVGYKSFNIYVGNLKVIQTRFFLLFSGGRVSSINVIDDGFGSVSREGYFYDDDKFLKKIFFQFFFKRLSYKSLMLKIRNSYTIFKLEGVYDNYAKNKIIIDLKIRDIKLNELDVVEKILVTQPFHEDGILHLEKEVALYNNIIKKYGITCRLPHPREDETKDTLFACKTLRVDAIAEEVILFLLSKAVDRVKVYGLNSTVLFLMANFDGIDCYSVRAVEYGITPPKISNGVKIVNL